VDNKRPSAAFIEKICIVIRTTCGVRRHGNRADLHRAEIGDGEFGNVRQKQHDSLLFLDPQSEESISRTIHLLRNLSVGELSRFGPYRDLLAASLAQVAVEKVIDNVVKIGNLSCLPKL
jgi:hypothetical protein